MDDNERCMEWKEEVKIFFVSIESNTQYVKQKGKWLHYACFLG